MNGYAGEILKVNLTTNVIQTLDTSQYVPDFIGGYGIALKLIWDETVGKPFPSEYSPDAPLVIATGPCAGTPAPTSGRSEVVGIAPQGYPQPWVADSGFGGDFAKQLKFAGYDAILLVGQAPSLTYLYIEDGNAELRDASSLQGLTTLDTQEMLMQAHGREAAIASIGPAGENLVRLAIIEAKTENAAGQGGFGAVMGSKKLKAIVVNGGRCAIQVARPDVLLYETRKIADELPQGSTAGIGLPRKLLTQYPRYCVRKQSGCTSCGECTMPFQDYYENVPMHYIGTGMLSGVYHCVAAAAPALLKGNTDIEAGGFEIAKLCDWLGLNEWEMFEGMNWFIQNCYNAGGLQTLMGQDLSLNQNGPAVYPKEEAEAYLGFTPEQAVQFIQAMAYRKGDGDIFAEGTPRAAEKLGLQDLVWQTHKHGYGPHWDGRYLHFVHFPMWVISAALWGTRGRDPMNSTHGAVQNYHRAVKEWTDDGPIPYEQLKVIGRKVYGTEYAFAGWPDDEEMGYRDKEIVVIWHENRHVMKCSLPVCDQSFPMTYSTATSDMVGDFTAEVRLFNAVVGTDWSLDDMHKATERCYNVLRALHIRQGRTRLEDDSIIRYFEEQPSMYPDEPQRLNPDLYRQMMDRYYDRRGWSTESGFPTRAKLHGLGLDDVADELAREGKLA